MKPSKRQCRIAFTVVDRGGQKLLEVVEEVPESTSLKSILGRGKQWLGTLDEVSLRYEISELSV